MQGTTSIELPNVPESAIDHGGTHLYTYNPFGMLEITDVIGVARPCLEQWSHEPDVRGLWEDDVTSTKLGTENTISLLVIMAPSMTASPLGSVAGIFGLKVAMTRPEAGCEYECQLDTNSIPG